MQLTLDENSANYQIHAFKPGLIQINRDIFDHSVIISASQLITNWPPQHITELTREHLAIVSDMQPAILIIGTGAELTFPTPEIYGDLVNQGIGVEIMNTYAACRTYTVLTAEGRNVVAALILN